MIRREVKSGKRKALFTDRESFDELREVASDFTRQVIKPRFQDVVSDWSTEVNFAIKVKVTRYVIETQVMPTGKGKRIFQYVDLGTQPHVIRPRGKRRRRGGANMLAFQTGHQPKTLPVAQAHAGSGRAAGPLVFAGVVNHPGSEARKFSETIHHETTKDFKRVIDNALARLSRRK